MEQMAAIRRSVSITAEQDALLRKYHVSLSKLTQKAIKQELENLRFAERTAKAWKEIDAGKGITMSAEEFLKELKKW